MKKSSVLLDTLRRHFKRPVATALALIFPLWAAQVQGATTLYYQGYDGNWTDPLQWSTQSDLSDFVTWTDGDIATFAGVPGTVTLGGPVTASGMVFNSDGNVITGDTLTLASIAGVSGAPMVNVASFQHAEIDSIIAGSSGLTKTGNGTLVLGNSGNTFKGDVVINGGAVVITDQGQLGKGTTTVSINGLANTGNPGYSGGSLVVQGGLTGITIDRSISMVGRGPGANNNSAGLISIGNNTFTGNIVVGSTGSEGRFLSTNGITTITGGVQLGSGGSETFMGNGNTIISGIVTGYDTATQDRFVKTGSTIGSTLWLQNVNNNFAQPLRIDSGTVRVTDNGDLGNSISPRAVDLNGGWLEVHTDTPNFGTRNVYARGTNAYILADRALGGTGLNQTLQFGNLDADNATFNFYGRDGYNLAFNGSTGAGTALQWSGGGNLTFNNNTSGTLMLNMNISHDSETTARTVSFNGNGDTVLTGAFLAVGSSTATNVAKGGNGQLTLTDVTIPSNVTGTTTINAGTLAFYSANALPTGSVYIGNGTTTSGALTYLGAGETLVNPIQINTTTANAYLNASGTGALIINGTITAVAGAKTLVLGGTNTNDNTISSALPSATTNLQKVGAGTWVLSGANQFTGTTTISDGTLKIQDTFSGSSRNVLPDAGSIIFNVDAFTNTAGGTLQYLGDGSNNSTESVGSLVATAGAATVQVTAGAGGTAALTFSSLGTISAGTGVNFVTNSGASVTLTGATNTNGILNAHLFYNGADFAAGSSVGAATYTTVADGSSLATLNTLPYLVNTAGIAAQATATINAGIKFNDSVDLTLASGATLTIQNGAATVSGGILVTGGSSVTISGGTGITSGGAADLVFRTDTSADTLTLNSPILSSTTGGWTKLGAGTLVLGAVNANTTANYVNIDEGTVQLSGTATLAANGVNVNLRQGATLDLNGVNLGTAFSTTGGLNILNGDGTITNSAVGTTATIRIGDANGSALFSGLIQDGAGQVALVKNGTGTIVLSGTNTFSGAVTLLNGNLDVPSLGNIGQASGIGTGDATNAATNAASLVFNGGNLRYMGTNSAGVVSATQTPSVSTDRLFTLAGNGGIYSFGSYGFTAQGRASNNAALVFANTAPVSFTGTGARTLTLGGDSTGDNQINLQLIDNTVDGSALTLVSSSTGLWILGNNANSYSGPTVINSGALRADDGASLPTTSSLRLNGGVLQTSGLFTRAIGAGAGQVEWSDSGTGANKNGGFAASTAPLTVNLGGAGAGVVWGTGGIGNGTGTLILSSNTSWADVNFVNPIDLNVTTGTVVRTIQVDDNGYTNLDYATVSGVISNSGAGTAGLSKTGSGNLVLGDSNTYNGNTTLTNGATIVTSIGAAGATSSSFGANPSLGAGTLTLGNTTGNVTVNLLYVGPGEVVTRPIILVSANFNNNTIQIDSSGSGPLNITNLTDAATNNYYFNIRGTNSELNTISADLADSTAGAYATKVTKTDGGVWALTGNNSYTGGTRIDSGLLGIGSNALGQLDVTGLTASIATTTTLVTTTDTSQLKVGMNVNGTGLAYGDVIMAINSPTTFTISTARTIPAGAQLIFGGLLVSNGELFATDSAGLETNQPVLFNNNSTFTVGGSNPITLDGNVYKLSGANDQNLSNNLDNGAVLTVNGNYVNLQNVAGTRILNVRGYGSTVWNGRIQDYIGSITTSLTRLDIRLSNDASFTLGGNNAGVGGMSGGILLGQGTLIVASSGGLGSSANTLTLDGGVLTSTFDLTGADKISSTVFLQGDPATVSGGYNMEFAGQVNLNASRSFVNNLDSGKTLTLSGTVTNSAAATLTIFGSGDTMITGNVGTGSGAQGLQYSGTGSLELTGTNAMTGTLTVSRSTVTISGTSGSVNAAAGVTLNAGGTLVLDNSGGNNASGRVAGRVFTFNGGALNLIGSSSGTSETMSNVTVNNILGTISMSGAGSNTLTFGTVNFANSGSSWDLSGISGLGSTNKVKITTYQQGGAAYSNTILPRIVIANDFARYDSTNGVVPFTAYNTTNNLDGAANGDTMDVTASSAVSLSRTLNALKIDGSGGAVSITSTGNRVLTLTTGSVISTGGDNTLAVSQVSLNGQSGYFQVQSGTTLHVTSTLMGTGQLSVVGGGTLSLENPSFYNSTTNVMGGTLVLNAGLNGIFPNGGTSLNIGIGATVDLNGNSQYLGNLTGSGGLPNTAGTLTNTSSVYSTYVSNGGGTFGGLISGNINFGRVGGNTLTLEIPQTYTGITALLGGATSLENDATLLTTSSILITGFASLNLNSNSNLQTQNSDRIGDTIPITMNSGTLTVNGRVDTAATETLGDITVTGGANTIQSATGGTGTAGAFSTQNLTISSLTRASGATVNFLNSTALGSIGNFPLINFVTAPTTYADGVLGPWAISNYSDYAAYNTANGVGTVGNGGYAGYSASFASGLITDIGTLSTAPLTTTLSGDTTTGMLHISGNFTNSLAFTNGTDVLNLELGGILRSNNPFDTSIGTTTTRGVITAGGTEGLGTTPRELIVFNYNASNPTFTNPNSAGGIVAGSPVVLMNSTIGIQPGMTLTNANFPTGTTVVSVDSLTQMTLSNNATASAQNQTFVGGAFFSGVTSAGSTQVTMNSTVGIAPGMTITNPGFGGATITKGSATITLSSTIGIQPGMTLTNGNLPAGTTVVSVDSLTQITVSQAATAAATSQTLSTVGFATGTYVVSVDSPTQVTLSQPATVSTVANSFAIGVSNMIINSVIADNGFGNMVQMVKSGTGVLNLSANNTYSGGTVVNQGTLNLIGSGVVIPAGGLTINNGVVAMLTNSGQIDPSTDVTLVGTAYLTLAGGLGQNNTLHSITFNNNGGTSNPTVTNQTNSILTLTSSTPVTVTSNNAGTLPVISGGYLALSSGANTFSIQGPTLGGVDYTQIGAALYISSVITGTGASITKTDSGLLQLVGQNTFTGGIDVQGGGLILGTSSTSTIPNTLVSGPLGLGPVSFADGTSLLVDNTSRTVANAMSFAGNPIFNNTSNGLPQLGLNGPLSFATLTTSGLVVNIPTPYLNVYLGGPIANIGSVTSIGGATGANTITKSGTGNITALNVTGIGSTVPINIGAIDNGTSFTLLADGDLTGSLQTINLGPITWEPAVTGTALSLTISRSSTGDGTYFPLAVNKTIAPASFSSSLLPNGLTLSNNSNYGLLLSDNIAFNTVSANQGPTFSVSGGSTSLQVDGLTLSGVLSGGPTGASAVVLSKTGGGVLTLTNTGNTFGGGGSIIDIAAGLIAASNDAVLGDSGNIIRLSGNNLGYGFRATGTFASNHVFNLNSAAGEFEVTQGKTLTLNNAFTFASANNSLRKYDLGTLELTQAETGWNGILQVQQGVVRLDTSAALGNNANYTVGSTATTGATSQAVLTPAGGTASFVVGQQVFGTGIAADAYITAVTATTISLSANVTTANPTITASGGGIMLSNVGSAIELPGGVTVADTIFVNASNNATNNGINGGGAIRSTNGINTLSGLITIAATTADSNMRAATLTADSGATLNITGGILGQVGTAGSNRHAWVGFGGAGTINVTTAAITNTGTTGIFQLNKFGTGTLNLQVASVFSGRDVFVKQGTLSFNGTGSLGALGSGQGSARNVYVDEGGTLVLDNSGTNVTNRLGGATTAFIVSYGNVQILGNSGANTAETVGAMTLNAGASVFTLDADPARQLNFTTAAVTRNGGSTLLILADNFGSAAGNGVATIQGSAATYAFTGELGATGATNKSILPWAFGSTDVTGAGLVGFVTADSAVNGANAGTNRLRLLNPLTEQVSTLTTAGTNVNLSSAAGISSSLSINSLQLGSGAGVALSGSSSTFLTIESGGLLVTDGSSTISGTGRLSTASNRELIIYAAGDLTVNVPISNFTGGLTKSGAGSLTLNTTNYFGGMLTINAGTVKLAAGDETIFPNQGLQLLGGILDLNGTVQNFNNVQAQSGSLAVNDLWAANTGGTIINTSGTQATLSITAANASFRGAIGDALPGDSNIAVARSTAAGATADWNLYSNNTYTGPTLLNGGRTQILDGGSLSGTSSIEISNATLLIGSSNISVEAANNTDRINDTASILLNGGLFQFRSRASIYTTETMGAVTVGYASSLVDFAEGGSNVNQADVTWASFAQVAGEHGTVRFLNMDGNISSLQRLFISNLNGVPTTNIGDGLTNNIIGGWATFEREFATYTPGMGVAGLTNNGYAGYSPFVDPNLGSATDNIRIVLPAAGSTTTLTADRTLYTLNMQTPTTFTGNSTLDLGGNTLTLASGGMILSPVATTALSNNITVQNGNLTAGTPGSPADFYLHALSWFNGQADNTGNADVTIAANFVDNSPTGGAVTLVIDAENGRGTLGATNDVFITGKNTYTGGTFVNSGRVDLNTPGADGVTTTATGTGDLTIAGGYSGNNGVFLDRNTRVLLLGNSQIANTATVTLMGGGTLDLNNFSQTLGGLVFNNEGGDTPTVTVGTGMLTLMGNITATGQNMGSVSTITGTGTGQISLGGSTRTIAVDPVQWNGSNLNPLQPNLLISGVLSGTGSEGIIKTGGGLLQMSGQNTFSGGIDLKAGGIIIGANSTPTFGGGLLTSGPLGTGALTVESGASLLVDNASRTVGNDINFQGSPVFASTGTSTITMTLNGAITLPNGAVSVSVTTPGLTVVLGNIPNIASITSITNTGLGALVFNTTGYTGDIYASALGNPNSVSLLNDGNGTGMQELINLGHVYFDAGIVPTVIVGRAGSSYPYNQPQNKVIAPASLSDFSAGLTVTNNNGYGLFLSDSVALNNAVFNVANATISTLTQGLYLQGNLSGNGLTKTGNGTLVLGSAANSFTGNVVINQGTVSIDSDGELGDAANMVVLSATTGTSTLRATSVITTGRVVQLGNTANLRAIEVSQNAILTLNSAFDLNGGAGTTATLAKNDNGTLVLNADNTGWTGGLTINAGAVQLTNGNGAGSGTITISPSTSAVGAALQLSGGVSVGNVINLQGNNNQALGGINGGGQLESVSGVNTVTGQILMTFDSLIGADAGATLNINGGINNNTTSARALSFNVGGDSVNGLGVINLNSNTTSSTTTANQYYSITKRGIGTLNITTALSMIPTNNLSFYAGTTSFNGAGTLAGGNSIAATVYSPGTLMLDNTVNNVANRLGGRAVTLIGGHLTYLGMDNAASTETLGALTSSRPGGTVTSTPGAGTGSNLLTFTTLTINADSTLNFVGAGLGTASNKIVFTTAPTLTNNILARATVNGADFATYAAGTGIAAFAAYDNSNNINSGTTTATLNLTAAAALNASRTINGIKLNSAGGSVSVTAPATGAGVAGGTSPYQLTVSSGGVLATGGNSDTISTAVLAFGGTQAVYHVDTGTTLTISSVVTGTAGWVKDGSGTLYLSEVTNSLLNTGTNTISGNGVILDGTVVLNGGSNTLWANQFLSLGGNGTLELNGNVQMVRGLFSDLSVENAGGTITGGSLTSSTLIVNQDNTTRSWSGVLTGALSFMRTGDGTMVLYSNNDYTGTTFISGGTTTLKDGGALSGTSDIQIIYATLSIDNSGTASLTDRVNDAATITLRGGTINYQGRQQYASTETLGDVTLLRGNNSIFNTAGGTGVNSADLNFGALLRDPSSTATLRFNNLGGHGQLGNGVRTTFTQINGVATSNVGDGLVNNIIGAWAIVDREFATYVPTLGVGGLNAVGFATGDSLTLAGTLLPTYNVRYGTTGTTTLAGNVSINTLTFTSPNAATTLDLGGNTLTLTAGGLLFGESSDNVNIDVTNGFITAGSGGAADLYLTQANYSGTNRTVSIEAVIQDNGGPLRLIKSSGDTGVSVMYLNGANTYTGGTYVNSGTLIIGSSGYIPLAANPMNGLVINGNNATVTQTTAGTIDPGNYVTVNGNATLNLAGNNTLAGLIFSDDGGGSAASQVVSNFGVLTLTNGIVSTTANPASNSTVAGRVDFGTTMSTIDISATTFNGQELAAVLPDFVLQGVLGSSGGITKVGNGVLQLGQDIYTGPTVVQAGRIQIAGPNAGARFSELVLGSGAGLNLNSNNAIFGSLSGTGYVINSGTSNNTLTVGFDGTDSTFSGLFLRFNDATPANVGLVKIGVGTLTFDSDGAGSTTTGALTINRGAVTFSGNGTSSFPYAAIQVNEGGVLNLDNTAVDNGTRLRNGAVTLNGGQLNYLGQDGTPSAETSTGVLTLGPSASVVNLTSGAGGTAVLKFGSLSVQGGSSAVVLGTNLGTDTKLMFTTTPAMSNNIISRIAVGTDFATYSTTQGIIAYTGYVTPADVNGAAGTATIKVDATTTGLSLNLARSVNAVDIMANDVTIGSNGLLLPTQGWTMSSGAVLVNGDNATISTPVLALGAEGIFRVNGSSLNITSVITGGSGITKTGPGNITLSSPEAYTGQTALSLGTMTLAGGRNTILVYPTLTVTPGNLQVNGGTLDLNGNDQVVGALLNSNTLAYAGGVITNSSSTTAILSSATTTNSIFGANLTGNLAFTKSGNNTLTFPDVQSYTGATIIRSGTVVLQDKAALYSGVSDLSNASVTVNYSTLNLNDSDLNTMANLTPVRLPAEVPVFLNGGSLTLTGGGTIDSAVTINTLTVTNGQANLNLVPYYNSGSTVLIHIGNFVQDPSTGSVTNFVGYSSNNGLATSSLGGQGYSVNGNIILDQINGAPGPVSYVLAATTTANNASVTVPSTAGLTVGMAVSGANIPAGSTIASIDSGTSFTLSSGTGVLAGISVNLNANSGLTNNLIGGWAVADGNSFATYLTGAGVSVMGQTTQGLVAPNFDGSNITTATATQNINDANTARTITGNVAANSLRSSGGTATTFTINSASSLSLGVGWITNGAVTYALTGTNNTSTLTSPNPFLYVYVNQATTTIGANITGNLSLVKSGGSTLTLNNSVAVGNNTFTGTTYANGGTTNLSAAAANIVLIPGDLVINNATVTMVTNAGQIAASSNVTINGGGILNLTGTNTLNTLNIYDVGGNGNPTANVGTLLTLTAATAISASNDNLSYTPTIAGTKLMLSNANPVINVSAGLSPSGLVITAPLDTNGGGIITKTGSGSLILNGGTAHVLTGGLDVQAGTLVFDNTAATNPYGTGTIVLENGVAIRGGTAARTVVNAISVLGNLTFGTLAADNATANATNNLTLSGTVTLGGTSQTMTVNGLLMVGTISGQLTGGNGLTKDGAGTLVLSKNTNNYGGATTVSAGTLQLGAAGVIPDTSALAVTSGGFFNLNGFNETVGSLSGNGVVVNAGGAVSTLTTGADGTDSTFSGSITDQGKALSVVKTGAGTQTLSGANSYTGTTTVSAGTLQFAQEAALYNNVSASWTSTNLVVSSGATAAFNVGGTGEFTAPDIAAIQPLGTGTGGFMNGSVIGLDTSNAAGGSFTYPTAITDTNAGANVVGVTKLGANTLALTGANSYSGPTNVTAGTLQVGDGTNGALNGTGNVTVVHAGSTIVNAPVLSGGSDGTVVGAGVIAGVTTIGDIGSTANAGVIAPGAGNTNVSNLSLTFTASGTALTVASGSQMQLSITTPTVIADAGILSAMGAGTYGDAANYITNNSPSWTTGAPATAGSYDFISLSNGTLSLGTRVDGTLGNGTVAIVDNGYLTGAQTGDVFNLLDWQGVMGGTFATSGLTQGGVLGDIDLPMLTSGLFWDTSAFASSGVLIVVPEPSRALLLLLGLLSLLGLRRRRRQGAL